MVLIQFKVEITFAGHLFTFFSSACYGEVLILCCESARYGISDSERLHTFTHNTSALWLTVSFLQFYKIPLAFFIAYPWSDLKTYPSCLTFIISWSESTEIRRPTCYGIRWFPVFFRVTHAVRPRKQTWVSYIDGSLLCVSSAAASL